MAAYEEVFSPKRYDMAIDFPVMDKDIWTETDKPSKFGNDFKRAKSGIVQGSVLFHEVRTHRAPFALNMQCDRRH